MINNDFSTNRPGRVPVLIATIGFFSISVLSLLGDPDTPSIIRLLLSGAIAISIYNGHNWARWLLLFLVILAEIFIVITVLTAPMAVPPLLLGILVALGGLYALFAALLFVPSWGGQYFELPDAHPTQVDSERDSGN